ncbi:MAG: NBR1-Ig-like domain-containing protein [Methylococcales bacterium]|nr:NBR1-Ig-like domain-containing protein [Methylococcales bacterium]
MSTELKTYIKQRCSELGLSERGLQRESGIARDTLLKILDGHTKHARLSTMVILARALKIHPFTLFRYFLNQTDLPKYTTTNALHKFDATGFIADVTYPDNCEVRVNETFTKIWAIQNIGSVEWIGRKFVCMDTQPTGDFNLPEGIAPPSEFRGLKPTMHNVPIPNISAGEIIEIEVEFTAPFYPCHVMSYWKMVDAENNFCFPQSEGLSCIVNVLAI